MKDKGKLEALSSIHELCAKGRQLRRSGQDDQAKVALQAALSTYRKEPDLDEVNLAIILDELANVCFCRAEYAEAEEHYLQAIHILEQVFDPTHSSVSMVLDHLARLYIVEGNYSAAEPICQRSLSIKKSTLLAQDAETLECMRMLAIVEFLLGKYDEAEDLLKKAIDILEPSTIGPFEEFVRLLGRVYAARGDQSKAEENYRKAISVFMSRKGQQIGLAQCELDYARLLEQLGRHEESEQARQIARVAEMNRPKVDDLPESSEYQPLSYPVTIFH